jgi:hypothetical protein
MAKAKKTSKRTDIPPSEKTQEPVLEVDETGESLITEDDPETLPPPDEELETTPPYEPPIPGEGP